jgi:CHC2 zinc finger
VYTAIRGVATPDSLPSKADSRRYRGLTYVRPIDAAKEAVPVIDVANRLCGPGGLRHVGKEWVGRCPLPDHPDRTPSFTVNKAKNLWFCHGCLRGGDCVELGRLAWGYEQCDAHVAAAEILLWFGFDVPQRPPSWYRRQGRQRPVRDALEEIKVRSAQRRLMRTLVPLVASIEDPEVRLAEARRIWQDLHPVARQLVKEISR